MTWLVVTAHICVARKQHVAPGTRELETSGLACGVGMLWGEAMFRGDATVDAPLMCMRDAYM